MQEPGSRELQELGTKYQSPPASLPLKSSPKFSKIAPPPEEQVLTTWEDHFRFKLRKCPLHALSSPPHPPLSTKTKPLFLSSGHVTQSALTALLLTCWYPPLTPGSDQHGNLLALFSANFPKPGKPERRGNSTLGDQPLLSDFPLLYHNIPRRSMF